MRKSIFFISLILISALVLTSCSDSQASTKQPQQKLPGLLQAPKSDDDFYKPPANLPSEEPGTIIWSKKIGDVPDGVVGYKVLYVMQGVSGKAAAASALLYAPKGKGKKEVVIWAHGVSGLADQCAPSKGEAQDALIPYFTDYIQDGYAIVAPDYEGLGTPGIHPFLVGDSEGKSILDASRMAQNFSTIKTRNQTHLVGFSQGGHGVLFAGQIQKTYAPELNIESITAIAPVGNLNDTFNRLADDKESFGYMVMGAVGFKEAYPQLNVELILNPDTVLKSKVAKDECSDFVLKEFANEPSSFLKSDPRDDSDWQNALKVNSPGLNSVNSKLLIIQGSQDERVPPNVTQEMFDSYCGFGDEVSRVVYQVSNADHIGTIFLARDDTLSFISEQKPRSKELQSCN